MFGALSETYIVLEFSRNQPFVKNIDIAGLLNS